ncbi:MAG: DNA-directed RNA polymerase subunit alpha [Armatimonadetes bacterium]|nr:DNA-directed RNA polymerase subunit alpha [Armatimonadota bacterium]
MPYIQTLDLNTTYGKFVLEPLERGYGQTIGNALRRVLLSSIQGASVSAIRIDKVFHEFAPIPGVKEDATQVMLNLKDLSIRYDFEAPQTEPLTLTLNAKGPGKVTGADIVCPPGVTVCNPEVYICFISDAKATFSMELLSEWGSGYVLPVNQERWKGIISTIPLGSQYTPVRKVNYIVEQTRVGTRTDYERLVLEVTTNGSVPPNDCITQAAQILDKCFRMFFELGRASADSGLDDIDLDDAELSNVPELKIEEMDFSQRTFNCLRRASLLTLRHLAVVTENDLIGIRGFGKKSLNEVRDKLAEHGLAIKPSKGGFRIEFDDDEEEDFD